MVRRRLLRRWSDRGRATAKDLTNPPPPPDPQSHTVDHYKCYRVRVTPRTPRFPANTTITAGDQFTSPPKLLALKKPRHLCTPVDKNGEGITDGVPHLLCYVVRPSPGSPKHVPVQGIHTNNQFGPLQLGTQKEAEFCVPSTLALG